VTLKLQLWLMIATLMVASFVGSFVVSNLSARAYLEEQLTLKNTDNANALAMSLSTNAPDRVTRELLLAAQFDTGNYEYIELRDSIGTIELGEKRPSSVAGVPFLMLRWFPIQPAPGIAQVSSGWQSAGTLTLQSHSRFAYRELWKSSERLFGYFVSVALVACIVCTLLLRLLTRPLGAVVAQAQAIGEGRFITMPEPWTREYRSLAGAMNRLSRRVQEMLAEESARLGRWHQENVKDAMTGLLGRASFMERLAALLKRDDATASGSVVILRLMHLDDLNRKHGRAIMDAMLGEFGRALTNVAEGHEGILLGRLNGSEIAAVVPEHVNPGALGTELQGMLTSTCRDCGVPEAELAGAATSYGTGDTLPVLLQRVDTALAVSEQQGGALQVTVTASATPRNMQDELTHWTAAIATALEYKSFALETYPVRNRAGEVIHYEAPSRMRRSDGSLVPAAQFMPWAARLGRMADLDLVIVQVALDRLAHQSEPLGVNLSTRILSEPNALRALVARVAAAPQVASRLWLEVPENGVYARLDGFRSLCRALKPLGCKLGIEHAGPEVSSMGLLYDLGLDYVKLDAALIRAIDAKPGNQAFVRGFCTIAHAIGLIAIAEGVERPDEWNMLLDMGIDGGTGRFFATRE
jgi:EAL domain-containing protein (putative c-di-GMP-specific phosphodiesterase class I)/GGDEF domain-containing protein